MKSRIDEQWAFLTAMAKAFPADDDPMEAT
jgi:hypothetical protein